MEITWLRTILTYNTWKPQSSRKVAKLQKREKYNFLKNTI
jgi:hypothetical protein